MKADLAAAKANFRLHKAQVAEDKKTANLTKLADDGVAFVKTDKKTGEYTPKKSKKGATHRIEETKNSVIAAPVKKWPKPPKAPGGTYGKPRISDEVATSTAPIQHLHVPEMPLGATHLEYSNSTTAIVAPITQLSDYLGFRGTLRFGKLRYNEDFVSMMPGEEGQRGSGDKDVAIVQAPKLPKPPKAPTAAQSSPSTEKKSATPGKVTRPAPGSKTGRIWDIADSILVDGQRPDAAELKAAVLALAVKEGTNAGTAATQFSAWRRFKAQEAV